MFCSFWSNSGNELNVGARYMNWACTLTINIRTLSNTCKHGDDAKLFMPYT